MKFNPGEMWSKNKDEIRSRGPEKWGYLRRRFTS